MQKTLILLQFILIEIVLQSMTISVKNLNFFYGTSQALFNIHLTAQEGETVVLLGPSGAGKSTLIRTLNLLEIPKMGEAYGDQRTETGRSHY